MFQEVGGAKNYVKYNECKAGDIVAEGHYLSRTMGKFGAQYNFMSEDGKQTVLNKSGQLEYALQHVEAGDYLRVIYEGEITLEKGTFKGKKAHQFKVLKDPTRKKVSAPVSAAKEVAEVLEESENPLA